MEYQREKCVCCVVFKTIWLKVRLLRRSHFDGLVQERRNSSALAMELCLSCTNPSNFSLISSMVLQPRNKLAPILLIS